MTIADPTGTSRLDTALANALPDLSRSRVKALIRSNCVALEDPDGAATITDPDYRVKPGQIFAIIVPEIVSAEPLAQDIALNVVHEDRHLIVIDKPAGLVVHPAPGNPDRTLVNALIAHCGDSLSRVGGTARPGIVHRLDKDTSGLMVAAKTDAVHVELSRQFAAHSIDRAYMAVVWGIPRERSGVIDAPVGRSPRNRKKMAVVTRGGKRAVTRYKVERTYSDAATLVACHLETGRTHQIRVHMAHVGHPVMGDPLYGRGRSAGRLPAGIRASVEAFGHQALHAFRLGFRHPETGEIIVFESGLPSEMKRLLDKLEKL